jgi:hypothetical protein
MKHQKPDVIPKPVWDERKCDCVASDCWHPTYVCTYCKAFAKLEEQYCEELDAKANGGCDW